MSSKHWSHNCTMTYHSHSLRKRLLWAAFTLVFYGFLRASEFATAVLTWQHIHLESDRYTVFVEQSKLILLLWPYHYHPCNWYIYLPYQSFQTLCWGKHTISSQFTSIQGWQISSLDRQQLTITIHHLLQNTHNSHQHYVSHSFISGAATTAAAAEISDWLIKFSERWRSNAYQGYICSTPAMLQSATALL